MEPSPGTGDGPLTASRGPGRAGRAVTVVVLGCYLVAAVVLAATGTTELRYSADHRGTVPLWHIWLPVAAALVLVRMVPPRLAPRDPLAGVDEHRVHRETWWCVAAAAAFAAALPALGTPPPDGWYVGLKLVLLAVLPAALLHDNGRLPVQPLQGWHRFAAGVPVAVWLVLAWAGPFSRPSTAQVTVIVLVALFLLNAVAEEMFYRRYLQTRLEHRVGRWPAIGAASLLWAVWHLAIHSTGNAPVDVASVLAHQGVLGLLLGYLWARYRRLWPLLVLHGAINAPPALLASVW